MTADEKRIAIAEADGAEWKEDTHGNDVLMRETDGIVDIYVIDMKQSHGIDYMFTILPDYLNSRDAIVSAILRQLKTFEQKQKFCKRLTELTTPDPDPYALCVDMDFALATATAEQLGDAFLAALSSPALTLNPDSIHPPETEQDALVQCAHGEPKSSPCAKCGRK